MKSTDRKKEKKKKKKDEKVVGGYTNHDNPFGDQNLSETFVWTLKEKKRKKEKKHLGKDHRKRILEQNQTELEKMKTRRIEREREKVEWEKELQRQSKEAESFEYEEWKKKEASFQLNQQKNQIVARIKENRTQPIDMLFLCLYPEHLFDEKDFVEPNHIINSLSLDELRCLLSETRIFLDEERDPSVHEFWHSVTTLSLDLLANRGGEDESDITTRARIVHPHIQEDITSLFKDKSSSQLKDSQTQIKKKLDSGQAVNTEYWEYIIKSLSPLIARTYLHETFLSNFKNTPDIIERNKCFENTPTRKTETDKKSRQKFTEQEFIEHELKMGLDEDEDTFNQPVEIDQPSQESTLVKPTFFNRIRTGFDWNQYNIAHYDADHPPPKCVKGYRFNIFYPHLKDTTKPPTYKILPDPGKDIDFCLVKFIAGPPYKEIAFRIVRREWEKNHKRGFKSVFERGVLHLWFTFKRYRYRR